jgi:hypothetical protein
MNNKAMLRRQFIQRCTATEATAGICWHAGAINLPASPDPKTFTDASSTQNKYTLNVRNFKARGNGRADDTEAFQRALEARGQQGGGIVRVPTGTYLIKRHLVVPESVSLEGEWTAPVAFEQKPVRLAGSVLLAVEGAQKPHETPFITLNTNSTIKGLTIFYPEQTKNNPPVAYPWCVATGPGGANNPSIIDVLMVNPYQAVDFGSYPTSRHYIRNLNVQALYRGIYVDQCTDIGRIENVHMWPFWEPSLDTPLARFTLEHGQGCIFGRTDWELTEDCLVIGYKMGFRFTRSRPSDVSRTKPNPEYKALPSGNVLITGGGADLSDIAVMVEDSQMHAGVSFVNCQLFGDLVVAPKNSGMVKFTGDGFFGTRLGANGVGLAKIDAGKSRVSFSNRSFYALIERPELPLIDVRSGRLGVTNCVFLNSKNTRRGPLPAIPNQKEAGNLDYFLFEPGVVSAVITNNEFYGPARIINRSKGKVVISNNVDRTSSEIDE